MTQIAWISEQQVLDALSLSAAKGVVREAMRRVGTGENKPLPKITAGTPRESAHCLASIDVPEHIAGFKTWVNSPKGALPVISLFDTAEGTMLGVVEAMALGNLRTASVAAVATELLAPADAGTFLLIGTGRQAVFQLAAAAQARRFRRYLAWSRDADRLAGFVERARDMTNVPVEAAASLEEAAFSADVITTITRASEPFLMRDMVKSTVHINAMGAIVPQAAELDPELVRSASEVSVDDPARALNDLELLAARRECVVPVWRRLIETDGSPRPPGITIFKSWGLGAADLMLALHVYRAYRSNPSVSIPYPKAPAFAARHLAAPAL